MPLPPVEERFEIRELYDTFYMALNEADAAALKSCFAPGGHIKRYDGEPSTPEFAAATGALWNSDDVGQTYQHHVTNVLVQPDPEGREDFCFVKMYFLVTGVWEPPHVIVRWSCKAHDVLQRVDGSGSSTRARSRSTTIPRARTGTTSRRIPTGTSRRTSR